ncbi:MAG TPA: hypothetical protein VEA58_05480, partial [Anaerovoracaceae bacterium]|nr:hypothetical protein [Anaerovoracaceae bacterium]
MIKLDKNNFAMYFSISIIVILTIVFTTMESSFLSYANISNLLSDTAPLMIMAAGMTPILLLGSIDLSVGSMCSVANVMALSIIMQFKGTAYPFGVIMLVAFLSTIIFSVAAGILLGLIHVKLKIPSFIASLAFLSIWS